MALNGRAWRLIAYSAHWRGWRAPREPPRGPVKGFDKICPITLGCRLMGA